MKQRRSIVLLRVSAVALSVVLVLGFLNYRTTGRIIPGFLLQPQMSGDRTSIESDASHQQLDQSASAPLFSTTNDYSESTSSGNIVMPGSKWAPIVEPDDVNDEEQEFFVGTKSAAVLRPEDLREPETVANDSSGMSAEPDDER